jgi:uncharacterized protein (TIGR04255 family)
MGKRYRNPPVIEAVCEFRFEPSVPWDLAIPGLVYEKIREGFPKRRQTKVFEVSLAGAPTGVEQRVQSIDRMQFFREDEKALIQVDRDLLAVNHLKPYPTWQDFLPLIRQGFDAYRQVANPKGVLNIGLRYINRIEIPGQRAKLEDYFEFRPFVGPNLPQEFGAFIVGIQASFENSRDNLRLQIASAAIEAPDSVALMLDLDYHLSQPGQVLLDNVFEWMEIAHGHVEETFEACITERLGEMFGQVIEK